MATQTEVRLDIVGGDSKEQLLVQLFDIGRMDADMRPTFEVSVEHGVTALGLNINSISADDGSGNHWIIRGHVVQVSGRISFIHTYSQRRIEAFYDSRTRRGWLLLLAE